MQRTTLGILAHVDAGKTTLSEQILTLSGVRRSAGRVDHKDTLMDADSIERERGITIFSDQCEFSYGGRDFTLIDTPGHIDFSAEAERAIAALDCAILLADASEKLPPHTARLAALAAVHHIPIVLFLNKCDLTAANPERAAASAAERLKTECLLLPCADERLAELDETFLECFLDGDYDEDARNQALRRIFIGQGAVLALRGSALKGEAVALLLDTLCALLPRKPLCDDAPFEAEIYKIRHDEKGRRLCFLRLRSGCLRTRAEILCGDCVEKVHELRRVYGTKSENTDCAHAGDTPALIGSNVLRCGDCLVSDAQGRITRSSHHSPETKAALVSAISCSDKITPTAFLDILRLLEDEDPLLEIEHEPRTREILVHVMGPVQLEVLEQLLLTRYGLHVSFSETRVLYMETIAAPVQGYGHYEPLRHYAEAHILLEPLPRGSGIRFESRCHVARLALPYQKTVENALLGKRHLGVLTGAPLTDVCLVLTDGRGHDKHTEGGDFREASCRAVRQALMNAESVLLEPYYRFEIRVPQSLSGRVMSDLRAMNGTFEAPQISGDEVTVCGRGPVSTFAEYPLSLRSFSHGEGSILLLADGYDCCHNPEAVIAAADYRAEGDLENPADSVFCSHGAGYNVSWREAREKMHCLQK